MESFRIDPSSIRFDAPQELWMLGVPAILLLLWLWQLMLRLRDRRRMARSRLLPIRERVPFFGDLAFWLAALLASAFLVVALALPHAVVSTIRTSGIDLVILQDGSASMRTQDVEGDRWQRSIHFVRVLGESLSWTNDRLALAVFARIATPQLRLTHDANTFFFLVDHLDRASPFSLEQDTTWDTNIESGIHWGLKLIERDEKFNGRSHNVKAFVLISDGQAWSGETTRALALAIERGVSVFAVGVGTIAGGLIPEPLSPPAETPTPDQGGPIRARLDRASLQEVAVSGGGSYYELDHGTDAEIASSLVDAARRRSQSHDIERRDDIHWQMLALSVGLICMGTLALRDPAALWLQAAGMGAFLLALSRFAQ